MLRQPYILSVRPDGEGANYGKGWAAMGGGSRGLSEIRSKEQRREKGG